MGITWVIIVLWAEEITDCLIVVDSSEVIWMQGYQTLPGNGDPDLERVVYHLLADSQSHVFFMCSGNPLRCHTVPSYFMNSIQHEAEFLIIYTEWAAGHRALHVVNHIWRNLSIHWVREGDIHRLRDKMVETILLFFLYSGCAMSSSKWTPKATTNPRK